MKNIKVFGFILNILVCITVYSQNKNSNILLGASYMYNIPIGEYKNMYENGHSIGLMGGFLNKQNILFSIESTFNFSQKVKDYTLFGTMVNEFGTILNVNGEAKQPDIDGRGFVTNICVSKIIPTSTQNHRNGIIAKLGLGYFFHYTFIDNSKSNLPQLSEEYKKGYDNAFSGINFNSFLGYIFFDKYNFFNFSIGLESNLAFAKSLRSYSFIDGTDISNLKKNFFYIDPKFTFIVPLKINTKESLKDIYYTD